jgi:hypothetical protein
MNCLVDAQILASKSSEKAALNLDQLQLCRRIMAARSWDESVAGDISDFWADKRTPLYSISEVTLHSPLTFQVLFRRDQEGIPKSASSRSIDCTIGSCVHVKLISILSRSCHAICIPWICPDGPGILTSRECGGSVYGTKAASLRDISS